MRASALHAIAARMRRLHIGLAMGSTQGQRENVVKLKGEWIYVLPADSADAVVYLKREQFTDWLNKRGQLSGLAVR